MKKCKTIDCKQMIEEPYLYCSIECACYDGAFSVTKGEKMADGKWSDFGSKPGEKKAEKYNKIFKNPVKKEVVKAEVADKVKIKEVKTEAVVEKLVKAEVEKPTIKQLALNNQLIRTYVSLNEASKHTGIAEEHLLDACEGVDRHIYAAFKWMYI